MATFALIHGAGDVGWYWHLVERVLRRRGPRRGGARPPLRRRHRHPAATTRTPWSMPSATAGTSSW